MMKRLLVVPFLFATVACMPPDLQEIVDRTGGCPNGICSNVDAKPTSCNGAAKFNVLAGTFKSDPVTLPKNFVIERSQYTFANGIATFIKFCEKKDSGEFESPNFESPFTVNSDVTLMRFKQPGKNEVKSKSFVCRAELTAEVLEVAAEGNCLVLKSAAGKQYFVKQ